MRLAIISDTHDNIAWLDQVLSWLQSRTLDGIVHCGDVQNVDTLEHLCQGFSGPVWVAYDPTTDGLDDLICHRTPWPTNLQAVHERIELPEASFAAVHRPDSAAHLAATGSYRYICHGHTHIPWEKRTGNVRVFCPGNLCGVRARPTFATLDTDTDDLQLHVVEMLEK